MTLAQVEEIFGYWETNPPEYQINAIIAQMLGWKPAGADKSADPSQANAVEQILAAPPPGMAVTRGGTGLPAPVFDLDEMRERNRRYMLPQGKAS